MSAQQHMLDDLSNVLLLVPAQLPCSSSPPMSHLAHHCGLSISAKCRNVVSAIPGDADLSIQAGMALQMQMRAFTLPAHSSLMASTTSREDPPLTTSSVASQLESPRVIASKHLCEIFSSSPHCLATSDRRITGTCRAAEM